MFGVFKPRIKILGIEFSGTVEAAGKSVTRFKPGDELFGSPGMKLGAHAEYVCVSENAVIATKPNNLNFEQAAVIPLAGNTALFFIRDLANLQSNQSILIHGASSAIGTFAIQLAKYYGAKVTGVCSGTNVDLVKSLGADKVIDYTKQDFSKTNERYDVIFSVVGKTKYNDCQHLLTDQGTYLENWLEVKDLFKLMRSSKSKGKKFKGGMANETIDDLIFLKKLTEEGKLKPIIGKTFHLDDIVAAFKLAESGHKVGNLSIKVS